MADVYTEAQRSVIGSLLIDPEPTLGVVMDTLRPEHFAGEWATIFAAVRALWQDQKPVDPVTVLAAVGDSYEPTLRSAMQLTPTAANAAAYCQVVRDQSALLKLRDLGSRLGSSADLEEARRILQEAEPALVERSRQAVHPIPSLLADFVVRMQAPKAPEYLPWGIRQLDEQLTAEPGDFIVLGADSSVGKTALAVQMAWAMASKGRRVGFFSLETSAKKLTDRIVAQRARVEMESIKRKQLSETELRDVIDLGGASNRVPLEIIEAAGAGVEDVRTLTVSRRYDAVYIDYVQLLSAKGDDRWEQVTRISMGLHEMAQRLGTAVIALSQITPAAKTKQARRSPTKDDLRESRQLKQDADLILMMSLADPEDNTSLRWLKAEKNKDGPLVSVCLRFDPKHMDFTATDSRTWQQRKPKKAESFTELSDQEELPWP